MTPTFIDDYMLLTEGNESPKEYHIWCMLYTLSVFAGRRFWFPFGPYNFYCNLYVMLVGEPGITKTSAMLRALHIVRESGVTPIAGTRVTKEALMKKMASEKFAGRQFFSHGGNAHEYNQYAIFASELVDFFGASPEEYMNFLTACWDQPVIDNDTKGQGQDVIVGPYITLLACMTPDKLNGYLKQSILGGGFARRVTFMYAAVNQEAPWPTFTAEQQEAQQRCIEFGKELQKQHGQFTLTEECDDFYKEWYRENRRTYPDKPNSLKGWFKSKGELLWKISMLINLATTRDLVIGLPHYKIALAYCAMLEKSLARVFEGAGINPNAGVAAQICHMLEALDKPFPRKKLEANYYASATSIGELRDTLGMLISCGRLAEKPITLNGVHWGSVIGTPAAIARYSDLHLAVFLGYRPGGPETAKETDQPPSESLESLQSTLPAATDSAHLPTEPQSSSDTVAEPRCSEESWSLDLQDSP